MGVWVLEGCLSTKWVPIIYELHIFWFFSDYIFYLSSVLLWYTLWIDVRYFTYVAMLSGSLFSVVRTIFLHFFFIIFGPFFFFFAFFFPPLPPSVLSLTPQQGFKDGAGWYRGAHVNQVPHGMGRLDWDDQYNIGEYKDGKQNGHGTTYRVNGKIWQESNWIDGELHGHATRFNPDGSIEVERDYIHGVLQ